jgi:5-methyltetrahydrofolate--homocysteine methyltransferase
MVSKEKAISKPRKIVAGGQFTLENLMREGPLVLDGAIGTQFIRMGLQVSDCPQRWNIDHRDEVRALHQSYVSAGSDIILTNTFGANGLRLALFDLEQEVYEINHSGVDLARGLDGAPYLIAGDVGPTGYLLKPYGEFNTSDFVHCYQNQAKALEQAAVDLFIVETLSDPREALTAVEGIRRESKKPIIVSFSFSLGKKGYHTVMGATPEDTLKTLLGKDIQGIGFNCGEGMEESIELAKIFRSKTTLYVMAKPNAGMPELVHGDVRYSETPEDFGRIVPELLAIGVDMVGGCCGTTPEHIRVIREAVDAYREAHPRDAGY